VTLHPSLHFWCCLSISQINSTEEKWLGEEEEVRYYWSGHCISMHFPFPGSKRDARGQTKEEELPFIADFTNPPAALDVVDGSVQSSNPSGISPSTSISTTSIAPTIVQSSVGEDTPTSTASIASTTPESGARHQTTSESGAPKLREDGSQVPMTARELSALVEEKAAQMFRQFVEAKEKEDYARHVQHQEEERVRQALKLKEDSHVQRALAASMEDLDVMTPERRAIVEMAMLSPAESAAKRARVAGLSATHQMQLSSSNQLSAPQGRPALEDENEFTAFKYASPSKPIGCQPSGAQTGRSAVTPAAPVRPRICRVVLHQVTMRGGDVLNIGVCLQNTGSKQNVQFLMGGSADEAFNAEFMVHQRSKDVPEDDLYASFPIPFDRFLLPNELMGRFTRVGTNLDAFVSVGTGTSIPLKDQYREGFEADIRKAGTKPAISERMIPASLWAVNITDKGPTSLRSAELQELFDYVCGIFDGFVDLTCQYSSEYLSCGCCVLNLMLNFLQRRHPSSTSLATSDNMPSKIGKIFDFIPVIINSSNGLQR